MSLYPKYMFFDWECLVVVLTYATYDWISFQTEVIHLTVGTKALFKMADKKGCKHKCVTATHESDSVE